MSDRQDNDRQDNDRLEQMLRRWGAEEAAESARSPLAPAPEALQRPVPPASRRAALIRWAPPAAAAAMLLAAIVLASGVVRLPKAAPPAGEQGPSAQAQADVAGARSELAARAAELDRLKRELDELGRSLQAEAALAREAVELKGKLEERIQKQAQSLELLSGELSAATEQLTSKDAELNRIREEAKFAGATMTALEEALAAARKKEELYRGQLASETATLRKMFDQEAAAARSLRQELESLRAQQALVASDCQRAYLSGLAPGRSGLRARQTATGNARLLERLPELRRQVPNEPARMLLDRLEVLLTRLEMIDSDDFAAAGSLGRLLEQSRAIGGIDQAIASGLCTPPLRQWLTEARFVLAGVEHEA